MWNGHRDSEQMRLLDEIEHIGHRQETSTVDGRILNA